MSDLPRERMRDLVELLFDRTREKKLDWKKGFQDNTAETELGNYLIRVTREWDREAEEEYNAVYVLDSVGNTIDTILPSMIHGLPMKYPEFQFAYQLLEALHASAYRQATGADQAIENLINQ